MLEIHDSPHRLCDGLSRRTVLRAGGLGLLGASPLLSSSKAKAEGVSSSFGKAKRCIVLFLMGGPPQHSTWDPKPDAPAEVRGELAPTATSVPGLQICEYLPNTAMLMDQIAVLRAVVTDDNAHSSSGYFMLTGHPHVPFNFENANPGPPNDRPNLGAIVQHLHHGERLLPPAVRLPHHIFNTDQSVWPGQESGYLGHAANPWLFRCEPASPNFDIPDFRLAADVSLGRMGQRQSLLSLIDAQLAGAEASLATRSFDLQQRQAFNLLSSKEARAACDLSQEADPLRDRYGRTQFGQSVLMARRLVESGVSYVHVNWFRSPDEPSDAPCWDSHTMETQRLKTVLLPPTDLAISALLTDLRDRGLLDSTLVAILSEFGRTPKFNGRGGRDHWGHVFSVALAGGGIRGGVVHGASDAQGAYPQEGIVRPQDITATMLYCLGYAPHTEIHDLLGRPFPISPGEVIGAIV
jgi:uncharacterized protein (DUF1501 family)